MESVSALRDLLVSALSSFDEGVEAELFIELKAVRQQLLRVFDFGGRSPAEQREVESGECDGLFVVELIFDAFQVVSPSMAEPCL